MSYESDPLFFSLLSRFQRLYTKSLTIRLSPFDVQPGYLSILHFLWQQDNITQKELHSLLSMEQATLSNTLKRMERDGLVRRTPLRKDRRKLAIQLTDKGVNAQSSVESCIDNIRKTVNKGLTINDRRYLKRIINQMSEQLKEDQEDTFFVLLDEVAD